MNFLKPLHNYLKDLSRIKFILVMTLFTYLIILPFITVFVLFGYTETDGPVSMESLYYIEFFVIVLIVPVVETFIFQLCIIKLLRKIKKIREKTIIIVLISAILFGIQHFYSFAYVFLTFFIGIILAYSFILYENKRGSAFWVVTAIHGLRNLINLIFLIILFF